MSGNGGGKTVIQGQLIAAGGAVLAALIGGAVALIVAFHHSGPSGSPPPPGVCVQGEHWFSPVNGTRVIRVTGTVQGLHFGEVVFAMAGFSENTPPFYSGGPAKVSKNGMWVTDIKGVPASALSLTFWPSEAPSSVGAACSPACAAAAFARDRRRLDEAGPHAAFLTHFGQPAHGTAPGQ